MNKEKMEDVKDTAVKLGAIYSQSPTDYAYLKGWIHCLLEKEDNRRENTSRQETIQCNTRH